MIAAEPRGAQDFRIRKPAIYKKFQKSARFLVAAHETLVDQIGQFVDYPAGIPLLGNFAVPAKKRQFPRHFLLGRVGESASDRFPAVLQDVLVSHGWRTRPEKRPLESDFPRIFEITENEFLVDKATEIGREEIRNTVQVRNINRVGVTGRFIGTLGNIHNKQQKVHRIHRLTVSRTAGANHLEQT